MVDIVVIKALGLRGSVRKKLFVQIKSNKVTLYLFIMR